MTSSEALQNGHDRIAQQMPRSEHITFSPSSVSAILKFDGPIASQQAPTAQLTSAGETPIALDASDLFNTHLPSGTVRQRTGTGPIPLLANAPSLLGSSQGPGAGARDARIEILDFAAVHEAARRGDLRSFVAAIQLVNWTARSTDEVVKAIEYALSLGAFRTAHQIAADRLRNHGDNLVLTRLERMLAPAKVLRTNLPADIAVIQNQEWLKEHASEYRRRWVALENGELLATAESIAELRAKLSGRKGAFLTRIP